jgi:hypothetical protein
MVFSGVTNKKIKIFNRCLVLLDVEGLYSDKTDEKSKHDLQMFALAVLCSSVIIYNTKNVIDASALDGLHLTSQIATEFMQTNDDNPNSHNPNDNKTNENNPNSYHLQDHFPILVWAIRDQFLDFEVTGKDEPSSDEYMEHCLQKEGCKVIRDHFRKRKCFAFPPPVSNMRKMKGLGTIGEDELDEDFLEETKKLLNFIKQKGKSKKIYQEDINGKSFSELLKSLTKSILEKNVNIKSICDLVEEATNSDALETAIQKYREIFDKEVLSFPGN